MRKKNLTLKNSKIVGIAADHGGHELKNYLVTMLTEASAEVIDFGNRKLVPDDDYPDFVVPLARAVASGQVDRGVAICGSGVGACIVANKVVGVRACLIHDQFSAHQGVEDDDLNLVCLGGLVVGCPNGESPAQISARADELIVHLRSLTGNVAFFSHGQFGAVLAARWIGLPAKEGQHLPLGTASLSILGRDPHHPEIPVIALWNSAPRESSQHFSAHDVAHQMPMKQQAFQRWENEGGDIPAAHPHNPEEAAS